MTNLILQLTTIVLIGFSIVALDRIALKSLIDEELGRLYNHDMIPLELCRAILNRATDVI